MPTVNNHDLMECLSWRGNARDAFVATKCGDNAFDADNFETLRTNQTVIAEEHDYAAPLPCISGNSYYGYQPFPVPNPEDPFDISMDTSEHRPLSDGHVLSNFTRTRKRNVEADHESFHQIIKKARHEANDGASAVPEVQGFGLLTPSFGVQTQNHPQNFDLPNHQVPASSSVLMDTMTPDNAIADFKRNKIAVQVPCGVLEDNDMTILESLLKYTHGCDIYNYELSDL